MGKKIKYSVLDKNTIQLEEQANKGDVIDLTEQAKLDTSFVVENFDKQLRSLAKEQAKDLSQAEVARAISDKDKEIAKLNAQIETSKETEKVKIAKAISDKDIEIAKLKQQIAEAKTQLTVARQDVIDSEEKWTRRYIATKTFGEALENFIYTEFEDLKQKGAFKNAEFYKDNLVIKSEDELKGTKGDFIFVQKTQNGTPIISVAIEVKTELNTTNKKKNKDHFDQLETNRKKKKCQYAVLISELEKTNKVYDGIYKVPGFEKMYVVRPQTFFSLMNMLIDSLTSNNDLIVRLNTRTAKIENKEQFRKNIEAFAENFNKSGKKWINHLDGIEDSINDSIRKLQDTLEHIRQSRKALEAGQNKVDKLSMKKLLKNCSEDLVFDDEPQEKEED